MGLKLHRELMFLVPACFPAQENRDVSWQKRKEAHVCGGEAEREVKVRGSQGTALQSAVTPDAFVAPFPSAELGKGESQLPQAVTP